MNGGIVALAAVAFLDDCFPAGFCYLFHPASHTRPPRRARGRLRRQDAGSALLTYE